MGFLFDVKTSLQYPFEYQFKSQSEFPCSSDSRLNIWDRLKLKIVIADDFATIFDPEIDETAMFGL